MERPVNPYKKGTLKWSIMEGGLQGEFDGLPGWEDLTARQIAEIFDVETTSVHSTLSAIKRETGYHIQRVITQQKGVNTEA